MVNGAILLYLYPNASRDAWSLIERANGVVEIERWDSALGPRPTDAEIAAAAVIVRAAAEAEAAQRALDAVEVPAAKTDLRDLAAVMQAVIDAQDAHITSMQSIIDGYDAATAAQQRGMIKDLARGIKAKSQEAKDIARALRRTIRVVT